MIRSPRCRAINSKLLAILVLLGIITYAIILSFPRTPPMETNLNATRRYLEKKLEESLKEDKGTGCNRPLLDPFASEITQFDKDMPPVICPGEDWVKCYLHECKVVNRVLESTKEIRCQFSDIIYVTDAKYYLGEPKTVSGKDTYILQASDHVRVTCTGKREGRVTVKWSGVAIGFRRTASSPRPGGGPINVLLFAFDSTSRNGFMRKMPKSYKYITEELKFIVLNGYNIVGDGTPAALFPILTGRTELELPDMRKVTNTGTLDSFPFIFYKLKKLGYHTAFFEDDPRIGTFQYRFNGFEHQPTDHYVRSFFIEAEKNKPRWSSKYCTGDTPTYQIMMNITEQFLKLPGSQFGFTFIGDICHNDFNMISTADDALINFLDSLRRGGHLDNTLLFIMGDHGPRYAHVRKTLQGKLEERLPLMAIHLPKELIKRRKYIVNILSKNAEALTTPHDIHATILDALDMKESMNPYKIKGADLKRGLSLFQPIPVSRSCSEAGIDAHWCTCLTWKQLPPEDWQSRRLAEEFVRYINTLTDSIRNKCETRILKSISWVMIQEANSRLLSFSGARDVDGYIGNFDTKTSKTKENYQIKVVVGPGKSIYEATGTYFISEDKFVFDFHDISRIDEYGDEPSCITKTHPHLNMYCYCRNYRPRIVIEDDDGN